MTNEEVARFALVLSEAQRIRAQIAEDEASAPAADGHGLSLLDAPSATERLSVSAAVAA